jgi:hypothetical protein
MTAIKPQNLAAQLAYRGRGNPPNTHATSAISNCFPGLEFDFRSIWRHLLKGIVLSENNNFVVGPESEPPVKLPIQDAEPKAPGTDLAYLTGHRLLFIGPPAQQPGEPQPTSVATSGISNPAFPPQRLGTLANPNGVSFMEWSNSFARILQWQGQKVTCYFTPHPSDTEIVPDKDKLGELLAVELEMRSFFRHVQIGETQVQQPVIALALAAPGDLTQGLCSPWQNDYRECACYYWAASRPDYVNVVDTATGESTGDNWMSIERTGTYILDNRQDPRLLSYDDLFKDWQGRLRFLIDGKDAIGIDKDGKGIPEPPPEA